MTLTIIEPVVEERVRCAPLDDRIEFPRSIKHCNTIALLSTHGTVKPFDASNNFTTTARYGIGDASIRAP